MCVVAVVSLAVLYVRPFTFVPQARSATGVPGVGEVD